MLDEIKNFSFKLFDFRTVPVVPVCNDLTFFSTSFLKNSDIKKLTELYNAEEYNLLLEKSFVLSKKFKNSFLLLNFIGTAFQALENFEEAKENYLLALKIKPNFAEASFNLGVVLNELNRSEESIYYFLRAIHEKENFVEAFYFLGILYNKLNKKKLSIEYYYKVLQLKPDHINASINLGNRLVEIGSYQDALKIYKNAVLFDNKNEKLLYNLANLLYKLEFFDEAIEHYDNVLKINKKNESAKHIKNSIEGVFVKTAPKKYVSNLFNKYAKSFDEDLVKKLKYDAPKKTFDIFKNSKIKKKYFLNAIDIGCGTGLSGSFFHKKIKNFYGIDVSVGMIEEAKKKNIYYKLFVEEAVIFFKKNNIKFDLFLAIDVFIYIGCLKELFKQVKNSSSQNSILCFSTENLDKGDLLLNRSGRFSHSYNYIEKLCFENNFKIISFKKAKLRKEKKSWIFGGYFVVKVK